MTAIRESTCIAVADGSYIREIHPDLCSAAFVLECTKKRGRIVGYFPESSPSANAFRGELMGLLAIHLLLVAANKIDTTLCGLVTIISDCLGALGRVSTLPTTRLPAKCKHSDILKLIMIHCRTLTFQRHYAHVKAHQDDSIAYHKLSRPAQLNCLMDGCAKSAIWGLAGEDTPDQETFPLEPVAVFIDGIKLTSDCGYEVRFWTQIQLAEEVFYKRGILDPDQFQQVAWRHVYNTLHAVPRMFALWAAKQVTDIAGTNLNLNIRSRSKESPTGTHDPHCPSCGKEIEDSGHVLSCQEAGRVAALMATIQLLNKWLKKLALTMACGSALC